jgi:hypothetical protein
VQVGQDRFAIKSQTDYPFQLIDATNVSITREEISNPYHFGVHFFLDMIPAPIIDEIDVSIDLSSKKYKYTFENPSYTGSGSQIQPEEVKYNRVGGAVTLRHYFLKFPPMLKTVRMYIGAGFGMQMISPIVGRDLIYDNVFDSTTPLNLDSQNVLKKSSKACFVGLLGVRVKPPLLPVSVRAEGRYIAMGTWDYEQPGNFFQLSLGISYSI